MKLKKPKITPIRILIFTLLVMAVISFIIRLYVKPIDTIESVPPLTLQTEGSLPTKPDITIQGELPTVPSVLPFGMVTVKRSTVAEVATKFDTTQQVTANLFKDTTKKKTVSFSPDTQRFQYSNEQIQGEIDVTSDIVIDKNKGIQKADEFVNRLGLGSSVTIDTDSIEFSSSKTTVLEPAEESSANVMTVAYKRSYKGYPLFVDTEISSPIFVSVSSLLQVTKASFSSSAVTILEEKNIETISAKDALNDLSRAVVVHIGRESLQRQTLEGVVALSITSTRVEYRIDSRKQIAIPMYRFDSQATTKAGTTLRIIFLLPAVKVEQQDF